MTTDTALGVTKKIVQDKGTIASLLLPAIFLKTHLLSLAVALGDIPYVVTSSIHPTFNIRTGDNQNLSYQDFPTITFNAKESVEMPFRQSHSYTHLDSN